MLSSQPSRSIFPESAHLRVASKKKSVTVHIVRLFSFFSCATQLHQILKKFSCASGRVVLFFIAALFIFPIPAFALTVTPAILNVEGGPKDRIKATVNLKNDGQSNAKLNVYAFVWDIDKYTGKRITPDQSTVAYEESLAKWIQVSRGVMELAPGESRDVPILVDIALRAFNGDYHAFISFAAGSTRSDALARINQGAEVLVNGKVQREVNEVVQLKTFDAGSGVIIDPATTFEVVLQNIGDDPVEPAGNIHITDHQGREVAVLPINRDRTIVEVEAEHTFTIPWEVGSIGRYKAFLDMHYGSIKRNTLTDTTFVLVIPKRIVLIVGGVIAVLLLWRILARRGDDEYIYDYYDDYDEYDDDVPPRHRPAPLRTDRPVAPSRRPQGKRPVRATARSERPPASSTHAPRRTNAGTDRAQTTASVSHDTRRSGARRQHPVGESMPRRPATLPPLTRAPQRALAPRQSSPAQNDVPPRRPRIQ